MTEENTLYNSVAPLRNVAALATLVERARSRAHSLPGMATFYGPSGFGKTTAALFATNKFRAVTVQVKSTWTAKHLCKSILTEMGLPARGTVSDMVEAVSSELAISDAPLLIDEADMLVNRKMIEIVRDIYEGSGAPVILIGEELLPQKLKVWERIHGRMLDWVAAQPADLRDVGHLAPIYAPGVDVEDDLRAELLAASNASIRRICVNLDRVADFARVRGLSRVGGKEWGKQTFFTGSAPNPRKDVA